MARIESGTASLKLEAEDLSELFHSVYAVFESDTKKKGIHFCAHTSVEHQYAICDKTKIQEIYLNIVSNAIKYTPDGHSIHVTIRGSRTQMMSERRSMFSFVRIPESERVRSTSRIFLKSSQERRQQQKTRLLAQGLVCLL